MNIKKINQALINLSVIMLLIIMMLIPAALIAYSWSFMGIGSLIFLAAYWYLYTMITELR